ncbi:MAG: glycosyltransferase family 2 protein [Bacteroidales bacterium]|nr:glycosyltransferase family 2 protein [Bacteroidales bacterium]MDD2281014.1 glycosyltransferase family 2 protein [Bacteroidales bacterium]MDD4293113.1 glycosyltransferase family 2 protein [Bacteroidales bacterium]MDD4491497.1 glycosyltransferase family 2 protein [Bacteroidales bacterium]HNW48373.1 glycosyltransferase family 2 protein [Bacteroidales bacterium]
MATIAVVILNWNGKHYLERFLPLLVKHSRIEGVSIVVADNGSTDGSADWTEFMHPSVRVIRFPENYGFTGGYNKALAQIEADYYILLNSDVEVTPNWIQELVAGFENNPAAGVAMPKILSAFDRESFEYAGASGGFIDRLGYPFCRGRILSNIEKDKGQYNLDSQVFWASGAAMMVRSSLYHKLGGLDDNFFAHMEEIDFCWRAQLSGSEVWAFPSSVVYHVGGGTLPNNSPKKLYLNYRNNLLMLYKNLPQRRLRSVLFARKLSDGLSAVVYLLQGKKSFFQAVWMAHMDFYKMKEKVVRTEGADSVRLKGVFKGLIVLSFLLNRGKPRFIEIAPDVE